MVNPAELINTKEEIKDPYRARLEQFNNACIEAHIIFEHRNKMYGDAITATGVLGATVELVGNIARLYQLVTKAISCEPAFSSSEKTAVIDTLIDIHNYANIARLMLNENNIQGELLK